MDHLCAYCESIIPPSRSLNQRAKRSKSGLLFCDKPHKDQALRLARSGDAKYKLMLPVHYRDQTVIRFDEIEVQEYGKTRLKRRAVYLKTCKFCGDDFEGTSERVACSSRCRNNQDGLDKLSRWLNGEHKLAQGADGAILLWARRHLMEEVHYACSRCRWSEVSASGTIPLEIDHIDGDWANSSRDNLRVLCPNCHSLTPTWRGANHGNNQSKHAYWKSKGWS